MPTRGACPQRTVGPLAGTYPTSQAASWDAPPPQLVDDASPRGRTAGWPSEVSTERDGQVPVWQMAAKAAGVQERLSGLQAR